MVLGLEIQLCISLLVFVCLSQEEALWKSKAEMVYGTPTFPYYSLFPQPHFRILSVYQFL